MERYTRKHYGENGYYIICSENCETLNCGDCGILDKIVDRLAAYEDTELSPEEIIELKGQNGGAREVKRLTHTLKSGSWGIRGDVDDAVLRLAAIEDILGDKYDLDRLRELAQADREGRCVVTPPDPATESDYGIICRTINPEYIHLRKVFEK